MRLLISIFWLLLGTINGCILARRVSPFSFTDLKMVKDLFTMQSTYFTTTEEIFVICGAVLLLAGLVFFWFKGPKYKGKLHYITSTLMILLGVVSIPLVTSAAVDSGQLTSYYENLAQGYLDYGFVYSFSSSVVGRGMNKPTGYSQELVDAVLSTVDTEETDSELPNIIIVQLESFMDPYDYTFLEYSEDPTPTFHYLEETYSTGYVEVPVVGAGTANTEFEVLTGMSMEFFGLGEIPYKTILKTNSCESVASVLSAIGYGTHVVHNNGGNFYSRANAFSMMGFDTFICKEVIDIQEYTALGNWATDACLVDEVERALDSTDSMDFVYTITVQSHGSYPTESILEDPVISVSGGETEEINNQWEYYMNQLYEVDQFMENLIAMLEERDEKTIVVFFGDHLPTMGLTSEDMASGSIYLTKYVTWNNFDLEQETYDLTSYQLVAYTLDQVGIHEGTIFTYHQSENYTVSDSYTTGLEILQYDVLYGEHYAYHGEDLYTASDISIGISEVVISQVYLDPETGKLMISGENFTKWSKVYVNGKKLSTSFIDSNTLRISTGSLLEGENEIVVNQVSGSTIFRSSNEVLYYYEKEPAAELLSLEEFQVEIRETLKTEEALLQLEGKVATQ